MAAPLSLTAIYETVENGWTQARMKELPGVITAAPTLPAAGCDPGRAGGSRAGPSASRSDARPDVPTAAFAGPWNG
jgi:hypothetical protein